jgi:3-oxoadipate enol-lactonase
MAATSVETITDALAAMRDRADSVPLLETLGDLPTLVVVGAEDRLTPPDAAQRMADAIPGAELVVVEGAGHVPPVERPATVNEALQRFLDRLV